MNYITLIFGSIRGAIWGGAAILLLTIAITQSARLSSEVEAHSETQSKLDAANTKIALAEAINRESDSKIAGLEETNRELAEGRQADKEASIKAVEQVLREKEQLADQVSRERDAREEIYKGNPNAKQWADTPVPADVYERLRNLSEGRAAGKNKGD